MAYSLHDEIKIKRRTYNTVSIKFGSKVYLKKIENSIDEQNIKQQIAHKKEKEERLLEEPPIFFKYLKYLFVFFVRKFNDSENNRENI